MLQFVFNIPTASAGLASDTMSNMWSWMLDEASTVFSWPFWEIFSSVVVVIPFIGVIIAWIIWVYKEFGGWQKIKKR